MLRCAALLLLAVAAHAADRYDWKPARVVGISVHPPLTAINAPNYHNRTKTFSYAIQDGDTTHRAQHRAKTAAAAMDTPVQYSLAEKRLYLRDATGKIHKLQRVRSVSRCPTCMRHLGG
jgi:hypothetical protein